MDDFKKIKELDKSNMLALLLGLDGQCREAKDIGAGFDAAEISGDDVRNIVFTGLGGSAIGADMIRSYTAGEIKIPIIVNRNYTLPNFVDENTLLCKVCFKGRGVSPDDFAENEVRLGGIGF